VVFPDADFKFYMDADVKTRAYRRWIEAKEKGEELVLEEVEKELIWRDKNDSTRKIAPLKKVPDAIIVNTSKMSISEQVSFLMEIVKNEK
ncbi:MAG TPA: cytidylate kinase, partial [Candidatus Cloacimonetes bacterium]|nr:cytidylate kinase [Candidatus Cloacimonadota bacterium]